MLNLIKPPMLKPGDMVATGTVIHASGGTQKLRRYKDGFCK